MAEEKKQNTVEVSHEELQHFVELAVNELQLELKKARHGTKLKSNLFDNMIDHFGTEPYALIKEYELIQRKQSKQPSGIRTAISLVVSRAVGMALAAKVAPKQPQQKVTTDPRNIPAGGPMHIAVPRLSDVQFPPMMENGKPVKKSKKK